MTAAFPHHYEVSVRLEDAEHAEGTLTTPSGPTLKVGPPPQFEGRPGHQSPEDLLLAAVASCHMTTLLALVRRRGLSLHAYHATASATLEKTRQGLNLSSLCLRVKVVTTAGQENQMERLVEAAHGYCIVSAALREEVALNVLVTAQA